MSRDWPLILAYHHIVGGRTTSRYDVSSRDLERQLTHLVDAGYRAISLSEAVEAGPFGADAACAKTFSLTFDDGLLSFAELAFPVIEHLGLGGATAVFVPTAFVGASNSWVGPPTLLERLMRRADAAAPLMSWDAIRDLQRSGVAFHSHGHRHLPMHSLSYEEARADLDASRAFFAEHEIDARYIALPYGWQSETCKRAIRDSGFDAAFSVERGGRDRLEIRRIPMYGYDASPLVALKLSGQYFRWYDAAAKLVGRGTAR